MEYEVVEDRQYPGDWRAEAIDYASEGECYVVIFAGPHAEQRAREYAELRNGGSREMAEQPWRVGRSTGRVIYQAPGGDDDAVGMMDTRALAAEVVTAVNSHAPLVAALAQCLELIGPGCADAPGAVNARAALVLAGACGEGGA